MFVIIVEDSPCVLNALLKFFERQGVKAIGCSTGHQAIAAIEEKTPDLLVSDWDIGKGASGISVVRYLRKQCRETRVIMITGRPIGPLKDNTADLQVDAYLKKPFSLEELRQAAMPFT